VRRHRADRTEGDLERAADDRGAAVQESNGIMILAIGSTA